MVGWAEWGSIWAWRELAGPNVLVTHELGGLTKGDTPPLERIF